MQEQNPITNPPPNKPVVQQPTQTPISPQPTTLTGADYLAANQLDTKNPKKSKKSIVLVLIALFIILIVAIFASTHAGDTSSKNTSQSNFKNNPLSNNGSVTSQAKYCNNPVNANLVC